VNQPSSAPKLTLDEIKAKVRVVCICKGIRMAKVCESIEKGCNTVELVNRKTGCGSGGCMGRRCKPIIEKLLERNGRPLVISDDEQDAREAEE
jgi:NAD(P)H-nitrite reductase large subunit